MSISDPRCIRFSGVPAPPDYTPRDLYMIRKGLDVSKDAMAEIVGCSRAAYYAWEAGHKKPRPMACRTIQLIAIHGAGYIDYEGDDED